VNDDVPIWEQRFRAPRVSFPHWARDAPERLTYSSNESGAWQVHAWDRETGARRQVTDDPIGVAGGATTPDGSGVVWFHDATGDEVGRWMVEAFNGDGDNPGRRPLLAGVPDGWTTGLSMGSSGRIVAGTADDDGYTVYVSDASDGAPTRRLHHHEELVEVAGLSRDSTLLALQHAEHGDNIHLAVRVVDPSDGSVVGELWDGPGLGLSVAGWSPVAGDQRLAVGHEREGKDRPAIWDLSTGARRDLRIDLPGDVSVAGWWPDGAALLLAHEHEGRDQLFRLVIDNGELTPVDHPVGTVSGAAVRPDGEVWFQVTNGATPPTVLSDKGAVVHAADGAPAPAGVPYRSWWFDNDRGQKVHGFIATPAPGSNPGPFPTIMLVHGGPTWAYTDSFMSDVQAWVDHGFAVAMVNYRGSTGYGIAFRDALIGDPGFPEVADVTAGLDDLVAQGIADPARAVIAGGSWGGYITLLALGRDPKRWAAAAAAVPVADYVTAYRDEAPSLQSFDRSLFGGSPDEASALYTERSPLTYVDDVRAPVLIIAGDNDSRCPIQQVLNYVDALEARNHPVEVYRFDAGHGSLVIDERIKHMRAELEFVLQHLDPKIRPAR
jgi:dipeptidyl aminopeptidase/acylaminoacyl peptidase